MDLLLFMNIYISSQIQTLYRESEWNQLFKWFCSLLLTCTTIDEEIKEQLVEIINQIRKIIIIWMLLILNRKQLCINTHQEREMIIHLFYMDYIWWWNVIGIIERRENLLTLFLWTKETGKQLFVRRQIIVMNQQLILKNVYICFDVLFHNLIVHIQ